MTSPQKPDLLILYHGDPLILRPTMDVTEGALTCRMNCPKCGARGSIVCDGVEGHAVWKDERDEVQIRPSLVCGNDCGWHVLVENGIARDV